MLISRWFRLVGPIPPARTCSLKRAPARTTRSCITAHYRSRRPPPRRALWVNLITARSTLQLITVQNRARYETECNYDVDTCEREFNAESRANGGTWEPVSVCVLWGARRAGPGWERVAGIIDGHLDVCRGFMYLITCGHCDWIGF